MGRDGGQGRSSAQKCNVASWSLLRKLVLKDGLNPYGLYRTEEYTERMHESYCWLKSRKLILPVLKANV